MYWLPGYLYRGDRQKLEDKTDWTQASDQERWYQESHFWTPSTHKTQNRMRHLQHKLPTTTDIRKLVHGKLRTRTTEPTPTATSTLRTAHTWPQTKPTYLTSNNSRIENNSKTTTNHLQLSRFDDQLHRDKKTLTNLNHDQRYKFHHLTTTLHLNLKMTTCTSHQSPTAVFVKTTLTRTMTLNK